ncbi:MAG: hypothetical protein JRH16_02305 [Deltaproteobacteria bacterium]|nr:hypothetical protein [Deltaproteobacteria bacterium]MBW2360565.1 hypothetical protein [Deltaproteobacteria bacterium]
MRLQLVLLLAMLVSTGATFAQAADETTRAAMSRMVDALHSVLPLSLDNRTFSATENRAAIQAALEALARSGRELPDHASPTDAGFVFLSRSLARDTEAIQARFEAGRWQQARFLLHEVTENCVACHSRRPDPLTRPLGRRLVDAQALAELPLTERVRLEIATRQFDRALESYTELLASPDFSPADLDLMGHLDGYLELCLRVRVEACQPAPVLARLAARDNVLPVLRRNLEAWQGSLRRLERRRPLQPDLAEVRRLVAEAGDRDEFPDDRSGLVLYFTASGLGSRYLDEGEPGLKELSEAYYWLGFVETRVGRAFWPSEGEYYLEAAIRVAPGSDTAEQAYDLLEEVVAIGYSGSEGTPPPEDVRVRLAELRRLNVEAGRLVPPAEPAVR